jgi:hypothetical protein
MPSVDEFLADFSPPVQEMALKLRALVLDVIPDAVEMVDTSARMLAYGKEQTYKDLICVVMLLKDSVNLGFARGTELLDSEGLLSGTGKKARHIKIKRMDEIDRPAVRALIEEALNHYGHTKQP